MKAGRLLWLLLAILFLTILILPVGTALADIPPDVIGEYIITVNPQPDGSLEMKYELNNYCPTTDFTNDIPYFEVGVPNTHFTLIDFVKNELVANAEPRLSGGSFVRITFTRLPRQGECFNAGFTIRQERMAYPLGEEDVSFQFTPGWFSYAIVKRLTVKWVLPEASLVRELDPTPTSQDGNLAIWQVENLKQNQKFTISKIIVAKSAYPDLRQQTVQSTSDSGDMGAAGLILIIIVIIIAVILIVLFWVWLTTDDYGGGYSGGGGSSRGSTYTGGGWHGEGSTPSRSSSRSSTSGGGRSSRSSGGSGDFSGRGSSCACVSCACACACAGGGRVGCSRKEIGYQVVALQCNIDPEEATKEVRTWISD